ncbi:MAG: PIG-L family deacetylase [Balneolales bacterium]
MNENLLINKDKTLRIIAVFAHPDDAEVKMGGTAAKFAEMGHAVKFVSLTNGDAGHHIQGGEALAKRRKAESEEAARRLGIDEYVILDNHDAELIPSLDNRHQVIREIRNWQADVVIGLRPNDYHPDHRYAGVLVMDSAYLVVVPNVVPDVPHLEKNPVFLYMEDGFKKPNPFSPDIVVDIETTFEKKILALAAHGSQFFEWLPKVSGILEDVPNNPAEHREWLVNWLDSYNAHLGHLSEDIKSSMKKWYRPENTQKIRRMESFEIAEYGHQPTDDEIRQLFPMLNK